jgi:uncharacterized OB-fold protein
MTDKPRPIAVDVTRPFWDALRRDSVVIQRCEECSAWIWYPRPRCTRCLSADLRWTGVTGEGTLHSYTVARQATHPAFEDEVPQLIAIVQLDEGVNVTTTIVDAVQSIEIGSRVTPVFDHGDDGITLLRHRLVGDRQ